MSIKQTGGVFGRNPTFNDVTIEGQLTFDGDIDINSDLKIDGDLEVTGTSSLTGNVAIGPSTADTLLHISGDATAIIRLENTDTSVVLDEVIGAVEFEKRDGSGAGAGVAGSVKLISANSTGAETALTFGTSSTARGNNAEAARFTSSGNLAFPSGQGIDFSATSGTGTSELLDDYEEGSWTPYYGADGGSPTVTYSTQSGTYTKIGRVVTVTCSLVINTVVGGSGALRIYGLPFVNGTNSCGLTNGFVYNFVTSPQQYNIGAGLNSIALYQNTLTNTGSTAADLQASAYLFISGSYIV